jgi:hypothetical protein
MLEKTSWPSGPCWPAYGSLNMWSTVPVIPYIPGNGMSVFTSGESAELDTNWRWRGAGVSRVARVVWWNEDTLRENRVRTSLSLVFHHQSCCTGNEFGVTSDRRRMQHKDYRKGGTNDGRGGAFRSATTIRPISTVALRSLQGVFWDVCVAASWQSHWLINTQK